MPHKCILVFFTFVTGNAFTVRLENDMQQQQLPDSLKWPSGNAWHTGDCAVGLAAVLLAVAGYVLRSRRSPKGKTFPIVGSAQPN